MNSPTQPAGVPGNGRMLLLLIAGLPLTMILAASWLWYFVERGDLDLVSLLGTANHGTLLSPPIDLREYPLEDSRGDLFVYRDGESRWTLLIPGDEHCETACEHRLYTTRQIHVAMGRDMPRLRRVYLSAMPTPGVAWAVDTLSDERPLPASFVEYLERDHPGMAVLQGSAAHALSEQLRADVAPGSWYLVDPAGWIMMRFDPQTHYRDVMADLKFLLKNS
jgi:hypothetical protein